MSFLQQRSEAKIRRDYIKHHRIILSLLVLLWVAPIWTNILIQAGEDNTFLFDILNKTSFFCIVSSTGIVCVARMTFDQFLRQRVHGCSCRSNGCFATGEALDSKTMASRKREKIRRSKARRGTFPFPGR
jgi:hypothetical protein